MISKDLAAASTTPLILSILSEGESYGYAIIQKVKELSDGEITWTDGMLYPVLHRLEHKGLIRSEWRMADSGRKRKYYRINKRGSEALDREKKQWKSVNAALEKAWGSVVCLIWRSL